MSNPDIMASSAGDEDEYTKMLIRQELDARMVDIEEKVEKMVTNQGEISKSVMNEAVGGVPEEFEREVNQQF